MAERAIAPEEKRQRLLGAAVRVFAAKGYHACRVGDIAEEAGVAYGLLYHYFPSKEAVLETIFRDTWTQMLDRIREVETSGEPAGEQIRRVAALVLRTWKRDPDLVRVLVREVTRSPQLQNEIDEIGLAFDALERIIAAGQDQGELRRDIDPRLGALIFYGAMEEMLTSWVLGGLPDGDEGVARAEQAVVDVLCNGIATSA
jgi:TetR/AcrR family transcriptional regulator, fatty acid metabolism regulator protein